MESSNLSNFLLLFVTFYCIFEHLTGVKSAHALTSADFENLFSSKSFPYQNIIVLASVIKKFSNEIPSWLLTRRLSICDSDNESQMTGSVIWTEIKTISLANESLLVLLAPETIHQAEENIKEIKLLEDLSHLHFPPVYFIIWPERVEDSGLLEELCRGIPFDADVYILHNYNRSKDKWKILEVYSIKSKSIIQNVEFPFKKLRDYHFLRKSIRRNNFHQETIIAVHNGEKLTEQLNSSKIERSGKFHIYKDNYGDYEVEVYHYLRDSFNFTEAGIEGTGYVGRSGSGELTGMAAQIKNSEADICITASELIEYRLTRLKFLHAIYSSKMEAYFMQPPSSSIRDILLHSFTADLWLAMFSTWILIVLGILSLSWVKYLMDDLHDNDQIILKDCLLWATGTFCQQGWHVCPESTSMKIVFMSGLFTGLLSYIAYSAALVSLLSSKVIPVRSIDDLINFQYFLYRDNRTLHTIQVIDELEKLHKISSTPREERSILAEDMVDKIVLVMHERGIRFRILENYNWKHSVQCMTRSGIEKESLDLKDVSTAFFILLFGHCLSFSVFIFECLFPPYKFFLSANY